MHDGRQQPAGAPDRAARRLMRKGFALRLRVTWPLATYPRTGGGTRDMTEGRSPGGFDAMNLSHRWDEVGLGTRKRDDLPTPRSMPHGYDVSAWCRACHDCGRGRGPGAAAHRHRGRQQPAGAPDRAAGGVRARALV